MNRRLLAWFLAIAFTFSWILFLAPLAFRNMDPVIYQLSVVTCGSLAMWGPGIAALLATLLVAKQPLRTLGLNRLGPKRYYLWAWFLPPLLTIVTGLLTVLFRISDFDPQFSLLQASMVQATGSEVPNLAPLLIAQLISGVIIAPFINLLFALGEELGWSGFLLPRLLPLGQWRAILISGFIWGCWHIPVAIQGQNYPDNPVAGIFLNIIFCMLLRTIFAWLYLNTRSPWVTALAHGSINAVAGLALLFLQPGFSFVFGGTIASMTGWVTMALFIGVLILTRRLPVKTGMPGEAPPMGNSVI